MKKIIGWNVDTQIDFMEPDGKLLVPEATSIKPQLELLTSLFLRYDVQVINTKDWHTKDTKELSTEPDYQTTFPEHCMANTLGAEYVRETKPNGDIHHVFYDQPDINMIKLEQARNIIIYKDAFDVFSGNPHTDNILQAINPRDAIVYGVATNVCVDYAVKGLLERGVNVHVVTDAIKELPHLPLEDLLESWQTRGAHLTTTQHIEQLVKHYE